MRLVLRCVKRGKDRCMKVIRILSFYYIFPEKKNKKVWSIINKLNFCSLLKYLVMYDWCYPVHVMEICLKSNECSELTEVRFFFPGPTTPRRTQPPNNEMGVVVVGRWVCLHYLVQLYICSLNHFEDLFIFILRCLHE